ncbi:recombinase family protein [Pseudonocardia sp. HH130630-07]|uniref:recombinase family protein n=1 Tax=Pseudonocardia sp. HH130630-07 TaxID=1690815 RepID=UPI003FA7911E
MTDPSYCGHQVWGRTRHRRPVPVCDWIRSPRISHPALIGQGFYDAVQRVRTSR